MFLARRTVRRVSPLIQFAGEKRQKAAAFAVRIKNQIRIMKHNGMFVSPPAPTGLSAAIPRFAALLCAAFCSTAIGADLLLTKQILDTHQGMINFAKYPHSLQPGDKVLIQGHTRDRLVLVNLTQGSATAPITVTNTGGQLVIDDVGTTLSTGIKLYGVQNVVLKGTPAPGAYEHGIKVAKADSNGVDIDYNHYNESWIGGTFVESKNVEVAYLEIGNVGFSGIQAKYEAGVTYPANALLDGLKLHHNYIHDTRGEGLYIGWTFDGHPWVANVSIHDNVIVNTGWDGIQLNRSKGQNAIYNNVVDRYAVAPSDLAQNEGITVSASRVNIYNNWVRAAGAMSGTALFYTPYDASRIYNNVFIRPTAEDAIIVRKGATELTALPSARTDLINNTIVQPVKHGITVYDSVDTPVAFHNNIIADPIEGTFINSGSPSFSQSHNLRAETVAEVRFADAATDDYDLAAGSPAIDAGLNAASFGVTTDLEGVSRPQGSAYDVGAYEFEQAATFRVLTPAGRGTAVGSEYCAAIGAFDAQPTWNVQESRPIGDDPNANSGTTTAYANRHWYIDLGPDWAKVRITGLWTRYRPYSGGNHPGFAALWWDDDNDNVADGTPATALNFATAQNLPHVATQQWARDREFASPVVPAGRYLVISTGPAPTDRPNEFAIIGYTTP